MSKKNEGSRAHHLPPVLLPGGHFVLSREINFNLGQANFPVLKQLLVIDGVMEAVETRGEPKIRELDVSIPVKKQVVRFDVSVCIF